MKTPKPVDIVAIFRDGRRIDAAVQRAVSAARQEHKRAGLPVAEWRDGKVVWIPADQIEEAKPVRKSKGKDRASARAPKREPQKPATRPRRR